MKKKLLALCLCLALCLGLLPAALGAEADLGWSLDEESGMLTITNAEGVENWSKVETLYWDKVKIFILGEGVENPLDINFWPYTLLTDIRVDPRNPAYRDKDGVLFTRDGTELLAYPQGRNGDYVVPDDVTHIGADAFRNCGALTGVTLPEGLTTIGVNAFWFCAALTAVQIPESVADIGPETFTGCRAMTQITVDKGNANYRDEDGVLFTKDMKKLLIYPAGRRGDYAVPEGVVLIDESAFYRAVGLTGVTLPEGLESLESGAFHYCRGLTVVRFPASLKKLKSNALDSCTAVKQVIFVGETPPEVSKIAFTGSNALRYLTIPAGEAVRAAYEAAFEGVRLPEGAVFGEPPAPVSTYKVAVAETAHGKVDIKPERPGYGQTVSITLTPDEGYEVEGLTVTYGKGKTAEVTDKGDGTYTFRQPGSAVTVTAVFRLVPPDFLDVEAGSEYYEAVAWVSRKGLMLGAGDGRFEPERTMTRAEGWVVLWRLSHSVILSGAKDLKDSSAAPQNDRGAWYSEAQAWVVEQGVSDGNAPEGVLTRWQFGTMISRMMGAEAAEGGDAPITRGEAAQIMKNRAEKEA